MRLGKFKINHYINYMVIGLLVLVLGGMTLAGNRFDNSLLFLLEKVAISIILAVSLSLVVGFLGELSLGHAGFMCVGTYLGGKVASLLVPVLGNGLAAFAISLVAGAAAAAVCGVIIGIPALRLRGDYLAIVTLAFGEIVKTLFQNTSDESFGGLKAAQNVNIRIQKNQIYGLIGPNGAGKTTTMQSITGLIPKRSGTVLFEGKDITKTPCHKIVHMGLTQVPEGRRIFQELTVYENLLMGAYTNKDQQKFKRDLEDIYGRFPRLAERRNQIAGTLSGGEQQMLAMSRAIMCHPRLLLLDEPYMGLSPLLVDQVFEIIRDINRDGTTILLVEQNAGKSLVISNRAYVLENGRIALSGTGAELAASEKVRKAYLGG